MINTKSELKTVLQKEYELIFKNRNFFAEKLTKSPFYFTWLFQKYLRREEYFFNSGKKIKFLISRRKKNVIGNKLGFYIPKNVVDSGLLIYHTGNIVINDHSIIGKNLKLHGANCIGNNGIDIMNAPKLGNNVELGFGAIIIGNVEIADNVIIGAGAVVNKSFLEPGVTLVGVPAKIVRK